MESELAPLPELYRSDWPEAGRRIDLDRHDRPHPTSSMEWWYVNAHVTTADARAFSLFAAFFRVDNTQKGGAPADAHFLTWALVDVEGKRYLAETLVDPSTPESALRELDEGRGPADQRLARALRE